MNINGKIYGRVLINWLAERTIEREAEKKGWFGSGMDCVFHMFVFKQPVEKYREKRKKLYLVFIALEKNYDKVCRKELWEVLYCMSMELKNTWVGTWRVCIIDIGHAWGKGEGVGEFFKIKGVEIWALPTWFFIVFFIQVVRQGDKKVTGKEMKLSKCYMQMVQCWW